MSGKGDRPRGPLDRALSKREETEEEEPAEGGAQEGAQSSNQQGSEQAEATDSTQAGQESSRGAEKAQGAKADQSATGATPQAGKKTGKKADKPAQAHQGQRGKVKEPKGGQAGKDADQQPKTAAGQPEEPTPKTGSGAPEQPSEASPNPGQGGERNQAEPQHGGSTLLFDPDSCAPWEHANRLLELDEERVWSIATSIENRGQLEPGLVRPKADDPNSYEVVFGIRRWAACRLLGRPFRAEVQEMGDEAAFSAMWSENADREDISPYSKGVSFVQAIEDGIYTSYLKLSSNLGISRRNLYRYLDLARLPEQVLEAAVPSRHNIPPYLGEAIRDALGRTKDSAEDPADAEKRQGIVVDILKSHPVAQLGVNHFWRLFNNRKKKTEGGFGGEEEGAADKGTYVATAKGSGENLFSVVTDGGHIERVSLYKGGRQRLPAERAEEFASRLQALIEEFEEGQEES